MRKWKSRILGAIIGAIYWLLSRTWKIELFEPKELQACIQNKLPFILAHWHGDELALLQLMPRYRVATLVSQSDDGEMMAIAMKMLGARVARGSSTRGGIGGLKGLMRFLKLGCSLSFAVDGPKGPIFQIKPGVFETSRAFKVPIFAAQVSCSDFWFFPKSWNKTYLPKPFAKVSIHWNLAMDVVPESLDPRSVELQDKLAKHLAHGAISKIKNLL